jgi:hypothetical protein
MIVLLFNTHTHTHAHTHTQTHTHTKPQIYKLSNKARKNSKLRKNTITITATMQSSFTQNTVLKKIQQVIKKQKTNKITNKQNSSLVMGSQPVFIISLSA